MNKTNWYDLKVELEEKLFNLKVKRLELAEEETFLKRMIATAELLELHGVEFPPSDF